MVDKVNKAKIGSSSCPPALSKLLRKFPVVRRVRGRTGRDHTQGGDKIRNTHVEKTLILTRMQTNERGRNPFHILPEINQSVNRFLEEVPSLSREGADGPSQVLPVWVVEGKFILILVRTVRKTLCRTIAIGVKTVPTGERWASTQNTIRTREDL